MSRSGFNPKVTAKIFVPGPQMAITDDHSAFLAHAHLNLLAFVVLFLFGIFYRLSPTVEANGPALPQVWIWIVSTVVLAIGVGLVHKGHPAGDPIAAAESFAILANTTMFTWLVFPGVTQRVSDRRSIRPRKRRGRLLVRKPPPGPGAQRLPFPRHGGHLGCHFTVTFATTPASCTSHPIATSSYCANQGACAASSSTFVGRQLR
jgi:hypothetical protein